jgi:hypothetical protein
MLRHALPIFLALLTLTLAAAEPSANTLTEAEIKQGWKLLFNGKDFTGWQSYAGGKPAKTWVVTNGCIKATARNGRPSAADLITDEKFSDFEFSWEWKIAPGGNSGVKYLVIDRHGTKGAPLYNGDDGRSAAGFEYQLLDDDRHPDGKNGPIRQTGSLYSLIPPNSAKKLNPVGEFNQSRIVIHGQHIEHWLNGAKIVEAQLGSPEFTRILAGSKYKPVPGFGTKFPTMILLQDHGDEVYFRNLKIRALEK